MLRAALVPLALLALSCTAPSSSSADAATPSPTSPTSPTQVPARPSAANSSPAPLPSVAPPLSERGAKALAADRDSKVLDNHLALAHPIDSMYVEDTFDVLAADSSAPFLRAVDLTRKTVFALWHGPFQYRPERVVLVWVFGSHVKMQSDLATYALGARQDGLGVYLPDQREIYLAADTAGILTICHELLHPLLAADFATAPLWLSEGLASLFELPDFSVPGEIHGLPMARLDDVRDALKSPDTARVVSLDALFALTTDDAFRVNEGLHYAAARHFLRWMDTKRHLLWQWYHAYRDGVLTDPTGEKAFIATFGETPAQANAEFVAWVTSPEGATKAH